MLMTKNDVQVRITEITAQIAEYRTARERIITHVPSSGCKTWIVSVVENKLAELRERREVLAQKLTEMESSDVGRIFIDGKAIN